MKVAVVVDSSTGLPPDVARGQQVTVVPLLVEIDGRTAPETEVAVPWSDDASVRFESPGVDRFVAAYLALARQRFDEVVSVHPPESVAPMLGEAREAAETVRAQGGPSVYPVDGQVAAMGLGWVALTAAGGAASGMTGQQVRDLTVAGAVRSLVVFAPGEQDSGRRRRGVVSRHPVQRMQRGEIQSAGNPISQGRAVDRIVELAQDHGRGWPVHVTVQHAEAPERALDLRRRVLETDLRIRGDVSVLPLPPSVAAQVGPGGVGLAISPADWTVAD